MRLLLMFFVIIAASFSTTTVFADETNKDDNFRCERFVKAPLKELKQKLQDNCDLNKPFSTSLSVSMGEDYYLYCCHKKKGQ